MKTNPSRSNSLNMRLFSLCTTFCTVWRKWRKVYYIGNRRNIVACDSFQGIKNRQPHIRLPAIAIIVTAINQNLSIYPFLYFFLDFIQFATGQKRNQCVYLVNTLVPPFEAKQEFNQRIIKTFS